MKKAFIFFLLFFFLFNSMGYYFLYELNKFQVKMEMQKRSGKNNSTIFVLQVTDTENDPSFRRINKSELRYKGKMYDVIKVVKNKNVTFYYCQKDTKEDNLLTAMSKSANTVHFLSLWGYLITIALPENSLTLADLHPAKVSYFPFKSLLSSVKMAILSPPPEVS